MKDETFKIRLEEGWFGKNALIETVEYKMRVLTEPKRKRYQILFQYLSLGIYKAPWTYNVELIT